MLLTASKGESISTVESTVESSDIIGAWESFIET